MEAGEKGFRLAADRKNTPATLRTSMYSAVAEKVPSLQPRAEGVREHLLVLPYDKVKMKGEIAFFFFLFLHHAIFSNK